VSYLVAKAFTVQEIDVDWEWLQANLVGKLEQFAGCSEAGVDPHLLLVLNFSRARMGE
jgi:hypothetical protein